MRMIASGKSGPAFERPSALSLEELLTASIEEAELEKYYAAKFVKSGEIPSDYLLREVSEQLENVVTRC